MDCNDSSATATAILPPESIGIPQDQFHMPTIVLPAFSPISQYTIFFMFFAIEFASIYLSVKNSRFMQNSNLVHY